MALSLHDTSKANAGAALYREIDAYRNANDTHRMAHPANKNENATHYEEPQTDPSPTQSALTP